ncbi:hypothetical protein [Pararhizobium sp.]|uniref:hypothetical protein n=1 Tax=Pararhizobium sp. TaxID=1977563 RepID=UPI00271E85C7|nr:hypothetical protein [Pararhizobium sp.]MDO9416514.1 hypothetical protein [Pararhizobium sp.]
MHRAVSLSLALSLLVQGPAFAASCLQEHAIYEDVDGAYELRFEPVGSQSAVTSNHFKLDIYESGTVVDGIVQRSDELFRPNGMLMFNCPEGDATGAEIAACTIWEGEIYAIDDKGTVDPLPQEGGEAATQLLFTGLGTAIRNSVLWETRKATVVPWDVMKLRGCKP